MALPRMLQLAHSTDNTTIVENNQIATAKDIAINGNLEDLASARGQIGDARRLRIADFNEFTKAGIYRAEWGGENPGINGPATGIVNGMVHVDTWTNATTGSYDCRQTIFRLGTPGSNDWHIYTRETMGGGRTWSPWRWILTDASLGDGLRFSGGIISVPEYEGAYRPAAVQPHDCGILELLMGARRGESVAPQARGQAVLLAEGTLQEQL